MLFTTILLYNNFVVNYSLPEGGSVLVLMVQKDAAIHPWPEGQGVLAITCTTFNYYLGIQNWAPHWNQGDQHISLPGGKLLVILSLFTGKE